MPGRHLRQGREELYDGIDAIDNEREQLQAQIDELVWNAGRKRAEAQEKEDGAVALVERTIEEGGR